MGWGLRKSVDLTVSGSQSALFTLSKETLVHGFLRISRRKNACTLWKAPDCPMLGEWLVLCLRPLPCCHVEWLIRAGPTGGPQWGTVPVSVPAWDARSVSTYPQAGLIRACVSPPDTPSSALCHKWASLFLTSTPLSPGDAASATEPSLTTPWDVTSLPHYTPCFSFMPVADGTAIGWLCGPL